MRLHASSIWFTDHAPFPDDRFTGRMRFCQLDEYVASINALRIKYADIINVHCGLEIEYLPSYEKQGYYSFLEAMPGLELLVLGQHMAEDKQGSYTFQWDSKRKNAEEHKLLAESMQEGMLTGHFNVCAHPDRIFRRCKKWDEEMENLSSEVCSTALSSGTLLEINMSSLERKQHYWKEFWQIAQKTGNKKIVGLDAHSPQELIDRHLKQKEYREKALTFQSVP